MLLVYAAAPFAAFRTFTAGWYRPTAPFLTPSAAYGLLLNVAGIESRLREGDDGHPGKVPASLTRPGLPAVEIAVGVPAFRYVGRRVEDVPDGEIFPRLQSMFQQLHNYPVRDTAVEKAKAKTTHGNKFNITPVRREFLADVRAVIAVKSDADTEALIRRGLGGDPIGPDGGPRYGVPFLGDNAFLLDRLEELAGEPGPVRWYEAIGPDTGGGVKDRAARLTVRIDRGDLSRTTSGLFAPGEATTAGPPAGAWATIGPPGV